VLRSPYLIASIAIIVLILNSSIHATSVTTYEPKKEGFITYIKQSYNPLFRRIRLFHSNWAEYFHSKYHSMMKRYGFF